MILNKLSKLIFRRSVITGILIALQLGFLMLVVLKMANQFVYIYVVLTVLSLGVVVYLVGTTINPSYKLAWTILILILPIFGGLFYFMFGASRTSRAIKKKISLLDSASIKTSDDSKIMAEIKNQDPDVYTQMSYLRNLHFSVYKNEYAEFFPLGEYCLKAILEELQKAKDYIFLEYFIIQPGKMWYSILDILKQKAKQGLDVRVMYDDCGSLGLVPNRYNEELEKYGIRCRIFNPLRPSLSITMNNRDHRKILVIDGKVGFTGGINLADEYINAYQKHGHWKDTAIMVKGQAVETFIDLFLENWNLIKYEQENVSKFYIDFPENNAENTEFDGYILPYGDHPYDNETVGENVYLNMINRAKTEIFISSPYLILDNELATALVLAAKSGVKVTVITPGIGDKWYVHLVTQAYYPALIEGGVNIYEYTPGFIHSKVFLCDDKIATVGTINLDYRSLFLHFECGAFIYKSKIIGDIKRDFISVVAKSKLITMEDCKKVKWYKRITSGIIRVLAPLM